MIVVHNAIWWLSYHPIFIAQTMESWFLIVRYISYLVLLIPATAGAALFFYLKQHTKGTLPPFKTIIYRAVLLSAIGFLMNLLAFGYNSLLQWNVLQFFSLSMIIVYVLLLTAPRWSVIITGILAVLSAPLLREIFTEYTGTYIGAILIGEPTNIHLWPLFPWFSVLAMGFWAASLLYNKDDHLRRTVLFVLAGGLLIFISVLSGTFLLEIDFHNLWGESIFSPPTYRMIGILGVGMTLLGTGNFLYRDMSIPRYGIIQCFSYGLFYIYVIDMIIGHRLQKHVLQYSDSMSLLLLTIAAQIVIAYLIGAFIVYLKLKAFGAPKHI
jgi:uncharacterized membrane protein